MGYIIAEYGVWPLTIVTMIVLYCIARGAYYIMYIVFAICLAIFLFHLPDLIMTHWVAGIQGSRE